MEKSDEGESGSHWNFSLQNIGNNKVADLISDGVVKKFKFVMKTDLIGDALREVKPLLCCKNSCSPLPGSESEPDSEKLCMMELIFNLSQDMEFSVILPQAQINNLPASAKFPQFLAYLA